MPHLRGACPAERTGDLSLGGLQDAAQAVGAGGQVHGAGGKALVWEQTLVWLE